MSVAFNVHEHPIIYPQVVVMAYVGCVSLYLTYIGYYSIILYVTLLPFE